MSGKGVKVKGDFGELQSINHWAWPYPWTITISRKTLLVLGVGLLLGFGLTFSVGANDTGLERPEFALTTLDGPGNVGQYTSVTIGADGLGLISYHDVTNRNLKVAHCSNRACTAATLTTLDSAGEVGQFTSVTIGADRLGLISYYDATNNRNLKVAHCSDQACTAATLTTLDDTGDVGQDTSVTIGADGLGLISYHDATNGNLKVAHCSDRACTAATLTTLDSKGDVGQDTSVTIGADGLGLISYRDVTNGNLKVAHCSNRTCTSATLTTLDSAGEVGQDTSVTIGADRLGLISYYDTANGNLKVAHCPTPSAFPPTAVAEQLGITESHHSKKGVTESLAVRKKKDGATTERESMHVGSF